MNVEYVVRKLQLFEQIECDGEERNGRLYNCTTAVTDKMLEPLADDYIKCDENDLNVVIPAGNYLFVQGVLFAGDEGYPVVKEVRAAAEQLWLEFLWTEKKPADSRIYLRVLKEEHGLVFQLMRAVAA
jgi:hypothetical protein